MLGLFCAGLFVVALSRDGRGFESIDVRQYGEMMQGVIAHGVPQVDNGPADRFEALRVPWNVFVNGRLWGTYPPLYPYLGAPLLALGWRYVWMMTFAVLIPLAIVAFELGRRVLDDPWYALVGAIGTVASTPILGKALEATAYPLAVLFATSACLATVIAISARGRRRMIAAICAGALSALGAASHLLCFPMGAASLVVVAIANAADPNEGGGPRWLAHTPLRGCWPTRETLTSAFGFAAGLVVFLVPVAWINHLRFGSYNPLSYGPTPWPGAVRDMNIGAHLGYVAPPLALGVALATTWIATAALERRRWLLRGIALAVALVALGVLPELRLRAWRILRMAILVNVDASVFDLELPYRRLPGLPGNLIGPWVLKSTIQATPLVALAVVVRAVDARRRQLLVALLLPIVAHFCYLTMRANLGDTPALGWAWVSMRYTLPALPLLFVAALVVVRELRPGWRQWAVAVAVAGGAYYVLQRDAGDDADHAFTRHVLLLYLPLGLAALAMILVVFHRRAHVSRGIAGAVVAAVLGLGFAIANGHDYRTHVNRRMFHDWMIGNVENVLPARFGLFGNHWSMDLYVGLRIEKGRDVEYADLVMVEGDLGRMRPLLDHWRGEGRPIYFVSEDGAEPVASPWPDLAFERVLREHRLYKVLPALSAVE